MDMASEKLYQNSLSESFSLTKKQMTKVSMRDQTFYTVASFKKPD